jgi:acyl carrier protein
MEDIYRIVRQFILEHFLPGEPSESLSNDADLKESGILDSLSTLKLVSFLEEHFRIDFIPEELGGGGLSSVTRIVQLVKSKVGATT